MKTVIVILIGYLLGNINAAYILGRIKGIDIRTVNSHNPGAANAKLTFGWWGFAVVWLFDTFKAFIAFHIVRYIYPEPEYLSCIAALMAIVGHCYPAVMGFKGGKGFSSYCGMVLAYNPLAFLIGLAFAPVIALTTNSLACLTMITIIAMPVALYFKGCSMAMVITLLIASLFVAFRHLSFFKSFFTDTEPGINKKATGIRHILHTYKEKQ